MAHIDLIERGIALLGALIVALFALISLRAEWRKTGLDDHVTKVMMTLLTIGCLVVLGVTVGLWGRLEGR